MNKKIYIVTSGEYSDYHIKAVFSTRKKAKEFIQHNGTDCKIQEFALDVQYGRDTKLWDIHIDIDDNKVISANVISTSDESKNALKDICFIRENFRKKRCKLYIETDTMNRAIKIAKERYFALKSNQYIWERMKSPIPFHSHIGSSKVYHHFNFVTNEFIG